jgi:hypothetical protein
MKGHDMHRKHEHIQRTVEFKRRINRTHIVCCTSALALAAALGFSGTLTAGGLPSAAPIAAAEASPDPSRFILNALFVPALDTDVVPLRWVDPRPLLGCGPNAQVRVNGEPLVAGALVPDMAFEIDWHADGCRPFGTHQTQFDGDVKLTVFREDWGFSAMVQPADLRITSAGNAIRSIAPGATSLP